MTNKKKKKAMIDSQVTDSVLMVVLTGGDVELLAIDAWLRESFETIRNKYDRELDEHVIDLGEAAADVVVTKSTFTPDEYLPS